MLRLRNTVIILLGINFTEMYFLAYSNYMCHKSIIFKVFFISLLLYECLRASLVAQLVKNPPALQEPWVLSLLREDPLEKGNGHPL